MKKLVLFVSFLFVVSLMFAQILINEVDADQTGTDSVEFIELYDGGAGNTLLDGYVIVLYNGNGDVSYNAYDLDTYSTDANGYFVIGSSLVPNVDYDLGLLTNIIQNGADAVALYTDDATSFPNGTAVTTTNLVDALVYDTNDPDDAELLVLLNVGEPQINEDMGGNKDTESMQRSPNGSGGARNTSTYTTDIPTPGTQNPDPPTTATLIRAYLISVTSLDVVYDISITSVDPGDYSLTGTASITFSGASIDGTDDTIVHLTGASAGMVADLTLDNIDDSANSTDYDFYAGIMTIANTNTNNPGGTILNDYDATFTGIISANDAYNNVWISDASGAYNGVMIFSYSFYALVNVGDEVLIAAQRDIYYELTELINPILISMITTGNIPYGPTVINGSDINETLSADTNPGESWEGQLVKIENVYVESYVNYDYRCTDDGGTTYFHVGDNVDYNFGVVSLNVGSTYSEVVGVGDWHNSSENYRINPRDNDDILIYFPPDPASNPNPEDGAINVSINTDLSWTNGNNTELIDLYFGNVNPPPLVLENNAPIETYDPGTLDYEETYFWKVVCKNVAGSSTADIWSFTTEIEIIPPPDPATNPNPENGAINVSINTDLSWTNGNNTELIDLYFGNVDPPPLILENNAPIETYDPGTLDYEETYFWKVICKNVAGSSPADIWDFTTEIEIIPPPDPATNPDPENGAIDVSIETDLSWTNGTNTNLIDLYFGNVNPPPLVLENNAPIETYDPGTLDYEETYYWKVVCKNDGGSSTADLWNFTTEIEIIPPPDPATNPYPPNGAMYVSIEADLSWTNGANTNLIDLNFGNVDPPPLILENSPPIETYDPGTLDYEETYYWKVVCKNDGGSSTAEIWTFTTEIEVSTDDMIPSITALIGNFPNPFNPSGAGRSPNTTISFTMEHTESTKLVIYNIQGQRINTLVDEVLSAGQHSVVWDGTNVSNRSVSSGIYFYQLKTGEYNLMKKMLLIK